MDVLIVYRSKSGFSQRYAEELAARLGIAAINARKLKNADVESAGTVVWCAGVYASRIGGIGKLRQLAAKYDKKRFFVLAVGATDDENGFYREELEKANLPGGTVKLFYAQGGFDMERMGLFDRLIIRTVRRSLAEKTDPTDEERRMLAAVSRDGFSMDENVLEQIKAAVIE